jgi:alanine racemase
VIRSTLAHIDPGALTDNFRNIQAFVATRRREINPGLISVPLGGSRDAEINPEINPGLISEPPVVMGVVKANAYGHGAPAVARALEAAGATIIACADIEEAITLREAGVGCRILVFGALSLSALDGIFDYQLVPTISTPMAALEVSRAAVRHGVRVRYHLKIDTGMNRLGFRHDNLRQTMPALLAEPNLELEAVYTHFATADTPGDALFAEQRRNFATARRMLADLGIGPHRVHAANSAALLADASVWFDMVRPGLLLYGVAPPSLAGRIALTPVMSLSSRVVAVKGVRTGETIGYGARFRAERPTTMAVVPAGYADGLDTRLAGRMSVLIRGRRAPIVGAVCMDMITIDVTGITVEPGDEVVLIGRQGEDEITVSEMADRIGSIPYELLCRVGIRIERVYNHQRP